MKGARRTEKGGSEGSSEDGPGALRGTRKMDWMGGGCGSGGSEYRWGSEGGSEDGWR